MFNKIITFIKKINIFNILIIMLSCISCLIIPSDQINNSYNEFYYPYINNFYISLYLLLNFVLCLLFFIKIYITKLYCNIIKKIEIFFMW
jgi:hypothetical protein